MANNYVLFSAMLAITAKQKEWLKKNLISHSDWEDLPDDVVEDARKAKKATALHKYYEEGEGFLGVAIGPAGGWFLLDELPEDVVNYLRPEGRPPWSWDAMYSNLVPGRDSVLHVLRRAGLIVFRAKIDIGVREITTAGVTIGSRVEGSEAAPAPITLRYPVTLEEFKKVLAAVNAEAEALWYAANDCVSTSPVPE